MSNRKTIDLSLLKKIVEELETQLTSAERLSNDQEYFVQMSKAVGLASGLTQETTALIADIYHALKCANNTATDQPLSLGSLLGKVGSGGVN